MKLSELQMIVNYQIYIQRELPTPCRFPCSSIHEIVNLIANAHTISFRFNMYNIWPSYLFF